MTLADLLKILLSDLAKAPLLLADINLLKKDAEQFLNDAGLPIPWAGTAVAHTAEIVEFENQLTAHKLGDGSLLKGLGAFLNSPLGQALLGLLLGKLGGLGGTKPAA